MRVFLVVVLVAVQLSLSVGKRSVTLSKSKNDYFYDTLKAGSESQKLDVLIDTTESSSFLFSNEDNLNKHQSAYDSSASDTYSSVTQTWEYIYHNLSANGTVYGTDRLQVLKHDFGRRNFGMDDKNAALLNGERLDGALGFNRDSPLMQNLSQLHINSRSSVIHYGDYKLGKTKNKTNITVQTYSDISSLWSFRFSLIKKEGTTIYSDNSDNLYAVIDLASPLLTFAMDEDSFDTSIWNNIGGDGNCDRQTRKCDKGKNVAKWISFQRGNQTWIIGKSSYYKNKKLMIQWQKPLDDSGNTVVYFGQPFLDTTQVSLFSESNVIRISYDKSNGDNSNTTRDVIIALSVVGVVALIFFGYFGFKMGIPQARALPENQRQGPENQVSNPLGLLQGQGAPGAAQGFQQRPMATDASRPPAAQPSSSQAQRLGGAGGARNPEDLRAARLAALERRQQEDGDVNPPWAA